MSYEDFACTFSRIFVSHRSMRIGPGYTNLLRWSASGGGCDGSGGRRGRAGSSGGGSGSGGGSCSGGGGGSGSGGSGRARVSSSRIGRQPSLPASPYVTGSAGASEEEQLLLALAISAADAEAEAKEAEAKEAEAKEAEAKEAEVRRRAEVEARRRAQDALREEEELALALAISVTEVIAPRPQLQSPPQPPLPPLPPPPPPPPQEQQLAERPLGPGQLFDEIDRDRSGTIELEELIRFLVLQRAGGSAVHAVTVRETLTILWPVFSQGASISRASFVATGGLADTLIASLYTR